MLKYSQYNKLHHNVYTNSLTEQRNRRKYAIQEKKNTDIDTIIRKGEFIDFLQSVEHPMVWIKDDGDWYRFKFVDEIEMNGNNSTN